MAGSRGSLKCDGGLVGTTFLQMWPGSPEETQEAPQAPVSNFSADLMKHKQAFILSLELQMNKPILTKATVHGQPGGPHSL